MIEAETARIEQRASVPTTLHLYRGKDHERQALYNRTTLTVRLNQDITNADNSLQRLNEQKNDRQARLAQTANELDEQLFASLSSVTCGKVYLHMREDPKLSKLSPKEFMDFFKLCLTINNRVDESSRALVEKADGQILVLKYLNARHSGQLPQYHTRIIDQMVDKPPEWFKESAQSWKKFVTLRSYFQLYLAFGILDKTSTLNQKEKQAERKSHIINGEISITSKGNTPDWFLEESDILPEKEIVENELTEDREEIKLIREGLERVRKQGDYLISNLEEKAQKATERLRQHTKEAFPNFEHFSDLILFGKIADLSSENLNPTNGSVETAIKSYVDSDSILTDQEPIALFIERVFKTGRMMQSAQDPIDSRFISLFQAAFEHIKAQRKDGSTSVEFEALKTTDNKAFGALNYDIKPFLEVLPIDEIFLLEDLLAESEGRPIELFIWDLAGTLSSSIRGKRDQIKHGSLHNLQAFTASFLKNHSRWAYEQLQESLAGKDQTETSFDPDEQPISDIQQEIETTTKEIAQGNLAGWQIFYADNRSLDERHFKEIGGQTLEEREKALQELLSKEHHLPSIKLGSIIRALDWLVTVPQEVEQTRIKKEVGDQVFKKLKRGAVRILYDMDTQEKKLIFFLHQKQAWGYGF